MDKKKIILYAQAMLCILWALLMAAAAISIFRQGTAYQAQGHPEVWIYTREKATEAFLKFLPLLLLAVAVNVAALILGVRDEKQDKPRVLPYLKDIYKAEREEAKVAAGHPGSGTRNPETLKKVRSALFVLAAVFVAAGILTAAWRTC